MTKITFDDACRDDILDRLVPSDIRTLVAQRDRLQRLCEYAAGGTEEAQVFEGIFEELQRARAKFPGNGVTALSLVGEVGELMTALWREPTANVRAEATQVAVMAIRVILDGDATLEPWRESKGLDPLVSEGGES